jgi:hypothetical protein
MRDIWKVTSGKLLTKQAVRKGSLDLMKMWIGFPDFCMETKDVDLPSKCSDTRAANDCPHDSSEELAVKPYKLQVVQTLTACDK